MFDPSKYITNNPNLFKSIQERTSNTNNDTKPLFYLMTDNPKLTKTFILGFPYIPQQIEFSYGANYNRISRSMAKTEDLQFTGNKAEEINITEVILDTRGQKKTFLPLIETLQGLMVNQIEPSFFYIAIQDRVLYPYVLSDMRVTETGWTEGLPVKGTVDFTFIRSPWGLETKNFTSGSFYAENANKRTPDNKAKTSEIEKQRGKVDELLK